jgi:protein-S-isoprenylcysteine O-methyltransferase Ste14
MTDLRVAAALAVLGTGGVFLVGVRRVFRRPAQRHRYRASLVSAVVFASEAGATALRPVSLPRMACTASLLVTALVLFAWAAWVNRPRPLALAFAASAPEHVQTRGPYALVRHPFYASYLLAFLGGLVAAGTPWVAPVVAAGAWNYWRAARREEAGFASSALADAYRAYSARVGMFFPRALWRGTTAGE